MKVSGSGRPPGYLVSSLMAVIWDPIYELLSIFALPTGH